MVRSKMSFCGNELPKIAFFFFFFFCRIWQNVTSGYFAQENNFILFTKTFVMPSDLCVSFRLREALLPLPKRTIMFMSRNSKRNFLWSVLILNSIQYIEFCLFCTFFSQPSFVWCAIVCSVKSLQRMWLAFVCCPLAICKFVILLSDWFSFIFWGFCYTRFGRQWSMRTFNMIANLKFDQKFYQQMRFYFYKKEQSNPIVLKMYHASLSLSLLLQ